MRIDMDSSNVEKRFKRLKKGAERLDGQNTVSFEELFNLDFMQKHTKFNTFDEMLENGGFKVENQKDFEAIDDQEWDEHVRKTTMFSNWEEMSSEAGRSWVLKQMGF